MRVKKLSDIFDLLDEFYDKESEFDPKGVQKALHVNPQSVLSLLDDLKELFAKQGAKDSVLKTFDAESITEVMKKKYLAKR